MIQIHSTLNPDLWDEDKKLNSEVRSHLLKIAKQFYDTLKITPSIEDITLTGSSANYNYTPTSDLDLHLIVDFSKINCDDVVTKEFFMGKKSSWNDTHNITIKGREVEVYVQDIKEPHKSTGVYSIMHNKWIKTPSKSNFYLQDVNKQEFVSKFKEIKNIIDFNIKRKTNYRFLKKIKDKINNMRKEGLAANGEMDIKNLVFKELRSRNYIDKLSNAINTRLDQEMSLEKFATYHAKKFKL